MVSCPSRKILRMLQSVYSSNWWGKNVRNSQIFQYDIPLPATTPLDNIMQAAHKLAQVLHVPKYLSPGVSFCDTQLQALKLFVKILFHPSTTTDDTHQVNSQQP